MISRVHWLLWELTPSFKGHYTLLFDYRNHNYLFYHNYCDNRSKRLRDCFIIIRSSKRCYRLMYYDHQRQFFIYRTFPSARLCAKFMCDVGHPNYKTQDNTPYWGYRG